MSPEEQSWTQPTNGKLNQEAYLRLSSSISDTYPLGRHVAIAGGEIVADADTFKDLNSMLHQREYYSPEVMIVRVGVDYSTPMTIFASE